MTPRDYTFRQLPLRFARTAAELTNDPLGWIEGPGERMHVHAVSRRLTFRNRPSLLQRLLHWLGF